MEENRPGNGGGVPRIKQWTGWQRCGRVAAKGMLVGALALGTGMPAVALAQSSSASTGVQSAQAKAAGEFIVTDNYPDLDGWLAGLGDATVVKIKSDIGTGSTVLPSQVTLLTGWQGSFFDPEQEHVRQIGYGDPDDTFTFESGSDVEVRSINFKMVEDSVTVPAGAAVTFKNCTFSNRIKIEAGGTATFENCTFTSGTIMNNGTANYTGTTAEPKNDGTPQTQFQAIGLVAGETELDNAMHGYAYDQDVKLAVSGTNKDEAKLAVEPKGEALGLSATVEDGVLKISGTPTAAGTVTFTVTATAPDEDGNGTQSASADVSVAVSQRYTVELEGALDAVRVGVVDYYDSVEAYVVDEDGNRQSGYDFMTSHDGAEISAAISPEGSGMTVNAFSAGGKTTVTVGGEAEQAGTYQVRATLTYKGQSIESASADLRIYPANMVLADVLADIEGQPSEWQMEPYEIWRSGNATVPTWLHVIKGSDVSGTYGQIGNNGTDTGEDAFASDTLTIPAGADVTLKNIKVNSSVKVVVEQGATLTLDDSVAFGPIEVNGGALTMKNSSATTSTITLNDGSTLKDSEVESNANFFTDGRYATSPEEVVIVNGTVTFEGQNSIEGDNGSGEMAGQTALLVNGTAVVPSGSTLTVLGGGDDNYSPATLGGTGLALDGGTVEGEGTLVVTGGTSYGQGGKGATGAGQIKVGSLTLTGGNAKHLFSDTTGGDAGEKGVIVFTKDYTIEGGTAEEGTDGAGVESVTIANPSLTVTGADVTDGAVSLKAGSTTQLEATYTIAEGIEGTDAIAWSSSDDSVATVDENGLVTGVKAGTATITASVEGLSASIEVTVTSDGDQKPDDKPGDDDNKPGDDQNGNGNQGGANDQDGNGSNGKGESSALPKTADDSVVSVAGAAAAGAVLIAGGSVLTRRTRKQ